MIGAPNVVMLLEYAPSENDLLKHREYGEKYHHNFYSCKSVKDYVNYVRDGSKSPLNYVAYSGDEEKSFGIFGLDGLMSKKQIADLKQQFRNAKSPIWHGIISFSENFGDMYVDEQSAERLVKTEFLPFLKRSGFSLSNIVWYAGLHQNTENRHIHFSFMEKEPKRKYQNKEGLQFSNGKIPMYQIEQFKVRAEQRLTDLSTEISNSRDALMNAVIDVIGTPANVKKYEGKYRKELLKLLDLLPSTGRISYDSENMSHLKPLVNSIVDSIIKTNPAVAEQFRQFGIAVNKRELEIRQILVAQKVPESRYDKYLIKDKYFDDIYRRLGNKVIATAKFFKKDDAKASRKTRKNMHKKSQYDIIGYCAKLNARVEEEAIYSFKEYLQKMDEIDYQRLIEEGEIESEMD